MIAVTLVAPEASLLEDLIQGLKDFHDETFPEYRQRYQALVDDGQHPSTLFIGCSDSRVVPDLITRSEPGELFLVRSLGAFVPPYRPEATHHAAAAALEYAVLKLDVTDIVVCGHSHCGAVRALYTPPAPETPHINHWLDLARDARVGEEPSDANLRRSEQAAVALQVRRLLGYPFVERRVDEGRLSLHGWHYVIEDGEVFALDVDRESFVLLG